LAVILIVSLTGDEGMQTITSIRTEFDPFPLSIPSYDRLPDVVYRLPGVSSNSSNCADTSNSLRCADKLGVLENDLDWFARYRGLGVYTFDNGGLEQRRDITGFVYVTNTSGYLEKPPECYLYYYRQMGECHPFAQTSPWRFREGEVLSGFWSEGAQIRDRGPVDAVKKRPLDSELPGVLGFYFEVNPLDEKLDRLWASYAVLAAAVIFGTCVTECRFGDKVNPANRQNGNAGFYAPV
jgi:hypothetical protein